jgi:hypothetical protein
LQDENVRVIVANRVLYAGSIEFDFSQDRQFGLRAAVNLAAALPTSEQSAKAPTLPSPPPAASAGPDAVKRQSQAVKDLLANTPGGPEGSPAGATATFGVGTEGTLSLKQTYLRPMAVGFGAALTYPVQNAMVPLSPAEQLDGANFCRSDAGIEPSDLFMQTLAANYMGVRSLANGGPRTSTALVPGGTLPSRPLELGRARTY